MKCLHPHCPRLGGMHNWADVVASSEANIQATKQKDILAALNPIGSLGTGSYKIPEHILESSSFARILELCPCLYSQIDVKISARGVVHLCEVTLDEKITSLNVNDAFKIQHPAIKTHDYKYPPIHAGAGGGDIMESLCAEVLTNHGIPHMELDSGGWPIWATSKHLSLNSGKMTALKLYGDILIPSAPHNILISVKSEAARERLIVSGNRLESVGFGFFKDASEFWTENRMNLLKRWGFVAIYMPAETLVLLRKELKAKGTESLAININGKPLYRPIEEFGDDMQRIAGKLSMHL